MQRIDYSKYSLEELLDVQRNIDPNSSNYPALEAELANRSDEISELEETSSKNALDLAEKRVRIIGYFQLAAVVVIPLFLLTGVSVSFLTLLVAFFVVVLNGIAGYTALKGIKTFYWVSILNQSLQAFSFGLGSILVNYSGLGGVYLSITAAESTKFGVSAYFSPGFLYQEFTGNIAQPFLSIDILAILFIVALVTAGSTANKQINAE